MRVLAHAGAAALTVALVSMAAGAEAFAQAAPRKGGPTGPPSLWRFGVSANAAWYENAQFAGGTDQSWSTGGQATLGYARRFRSGTFDVAGYGGTIYYPEIDPFSQATYGGSLGLNLTSSPRTRFMLGQSFTRSNTRQIVYDAGEIPLPTTGVYAATSTVGLSHQFGQRWQLGLNGGYMMRRYDQAGLVDGDQLGAGLQLSRMLGRSGGVYLSYQFGNSWYAGQQARAQQALLGARYQPARGVSFDVSAGAAYLWPSQAVFPAGSASLSAAGRRTSFTLLYHRDFGQAFGYGRQTIGDVGAASASWRLASNVSVTTGYSYGYRRDAQDTPFKVRSQVASGGVSWGTFKGFSVSARYSWESNHTEGYPPFEGSRVGASVSYGVEWR